VPRGTESRFELNSPFLVGDVLVEPDLNRLRRGRDTVHVESKIMDILVFLAGRGSRLVSRRELVDGVWGTEFICDNTLTHAISELRTALADDARNPRYIETIHRRGYRLLAAVTSLEGRAPNSPGLPSPYRILHGVRNIQLRVGPNLLGRAPEATVRIDSVWVSRRHARIIVDGTSAVLEDLGSRNGTFVNGRLVTDAVRLADGDTLHLGRMADALFFKATGPQASTDPVVERTPIAPHLSH
jgi:DNA-binding winged helix-turn-helix (wHTH) protein